MREIKYYQSESGRSPVEEFLLDLETKQFEKVMWVLRLIEDLQQVPSQYLKKLVNTEDIWEVRIQFGNNIFRILGFFDGPCWIVLANGFVKKSQKTPDAEIVLAEQRKKDYRRREKS
jgi:phage-related protein